MNLTESINSFKSYGLNTENTFSDSSWLVTQPNDDFGIQVPTNYTTAWQNITFSNITARSEYIAVQDGIGTGSWFETSYLICGSQGYLNGQYSQLAINFTVPVRVNLTSVWLRYGAVQDTGDPPRIPLNVESDSSDHVPSGIVLGNGTLRNDLTAGWNEVQIQTSGGKPVSLQPRMTYWLVMNGSTIPNDNTGYYQWYYLPDIGYEYGEYDEKCVALMPAGDWMLEPDMYDPMNLLCVLFVRPVDDSLETMVYSSPAEVGMSLNGAEVNGTTMRVNASWTSFQFTTNCSVTFTVNWTAMFEYARGKVVSTQYIAYQDLTNWSASFTSASKPNETLYSYAWYNKTFKVSTVPPYWIVLDPSLDVWNNRTTLFSFSSGPGYFLINQTSNVNDGYWNADWLIKAQSSYWATATGSSQVVAGLPLAVNISTASLNPSSSHCNVTFYNEATGYPVYSRIHAIPSSPYQFQIRLNQSGSYTMFLFDMWDFGNEVSLNEALTVTALTPLCNLTVTDRNTPIMGNTAMLKFRFYNNSLGTGNSWIQAETVSVNGTLVSPSNSSYDPGSGITTMYMSTALGGWRAGPNVVNVSAISGVFSNFTVCPLTVIEPKAVLALSNGTYAATYGDSVLVGFTFLNTTGSSPQPFPSEPTLYMNGSLVSFTGTGSGSYVHVLNTREFHRAGSYCLNFTACYGSFYKGLNITSIVVNKINMNITLTLDQRSVAANSSLSVSATLKYPNGTAVEDYTKVMFNFTVTYVGNIVKVFNDSETTLSGVARSAFLTMANMSSISVEAFYLGDEVRSPASAPRQDATVIRPTDGFPFIMLVVTGVVGASMVVAVSAAIRMKIKGKEKKARKESRLAESSSLAQLVVVEKASGRNLWSRKLGTMEDVNPHLISGFLSANESILGVIFKSGRSKAGLKFADYNYYKVIGDAGKYIMAAIFCTETPGPEIRNALSTFTKRFEGKYRGTLRGWKGDMSAFRGASLIFDEVFPLSTTSAYTINEEKLGKMRLSGTAKEVLDRARRLSASRGFFFMSKIIEFLVTEKGKKRSAVVDILDELSRVGIFKQVTVEEGKEIARQRAKAAGKPRDTGKH